MGDSVRPGKEEAEECMVEFLGGSREELDAEGKGKLAGPGGLGADFFFLVLEGALGLEDGLLAVMGALMLGALARAPRLSLIARGAATGGSIAPETFISEDSRRKHLLQLRCFVQHLCLRSSVVTLKPDPSFHNVLELLWETTTIIIIIINDKIGLIFIASFPTS